MTIKRESKSGSMEFRYPHKTGVDTRPRRFSWNTIKLDHIPTPPQSPYFPETLSRFQFLVQTKFFMPLISFSINGTLF